MEIIKVKAHGQKIKLRKMSENEVITERTVYSNGDCPIKNGCDTDVGFALFGSRSVGDLVSQHKNRHYYEVLSDFYVIQ